MSLRIVHRIVQFEDVPWRTDQLTHVETGFARARCAHSKESYRHCFALLQKLFGMFQGPRNSPRMKYTVHNPNKTDELLAGSPSIRKVP